MTARRPARLRRRDAVYRAIQQARLEKIAEGSLEPRFAREFYFLWTLRAQARADYADFILPSLLFLAEYELDRTERKGEAGAAAEPPASPLPEPPPLSSSSGKRRSRADRGTQRRA